MLTCAVPATVSDGLRDLLPDHHVAATACCTGCTVYAVAPCADSTENRVLKRLDHPTATVTSHGKAGEIDHRQPGYRPE